MTEFVTLLISIFAIIIAYISMISKKPRVYFKFKSIYNENKNSHLLNLEIINSGDKPAFDIKINPRNDVDEYIKTDDNNIEENIRYYYNLKSFVNCFKHTTKFLTGGDKEILYIGEISNLNGNITEDFKIKATITFHEEFIANKVISKLITSVDFLFLNTIISSILFFANIQYLGTNILLKSINYNYDMSYNKLQKKHKYIYEYSFSNIYNVKAIEKKYQYNNAEDLFSRHIYKVWESSLTKDELKYFTKYKLEYMYDLEKYINLIKLIDKNKKPIFWKKYISFLKIMDITEVLDYEKKEILKKIMDDNNE